ncbi:MAG TPA: hypothetical protein DCG38_00800 [Eubacteriaceae bacterium]|jgi:lysine decarboxylase|nr:hypothetical protein [Eubacteriaceae bacterium]
MKSKLYSNIESKKKNIKFHMPGHKSRPFTSTGWEEFDITELNGTDNLNNPKKEIKDIEWRIAKSYGSKSCIISVNGSTALIMAGIMGSSREGDRIGVVRNCHKSVFSAIHYGRLNIVFIEPLIDSVYGYPVGVDLNDLEDTVKRFKLKALVITYPTYYGTCDDLKAIKQICDRYQVLLIVDEAHGAHFKYSSRFPCSSIELQADITIHSTHKTLSSLNQGALLHINSDKIDIEKIRRHLSMLQTSSPSYPIILSVEEAIDYMDEKGEEKLEELAAIYDKVKEDIGNTCFNNIHDKIEHDIKIIDKSKIWLAPGGIGDILTRDYNIDVEFDDGKSFLCMMGAGTEKEDADRLIFALKEISDKGFCKKGQKIDSKMKFPKCGKKVMDAWQAEDMKIRTINIQKAEGKTSSSYLVPYPPGVPIVCPGEIITSEMIEYINSLSENSVEGMSADNMVYIIDEEPI